MAKLTAISRKKVQSPQPGYAKNAGFTLIEIMMAVVIIGVVASLAIPNYSRLNSNMQFEDAYNATRGAINRCRGEAVSMSASTNMSSGVTSPVSLAFFPNGFACFVWYDANANSILGTSSSLDLGSNGKLDAGEGNGEIQKVLFQSVYVDGTPMNAVPAGPRLDTANSAFGTGAMQNDSTGYVLRILPGGYFLASTGGTVTAKITMAPKAGPESSFTVFSSGQVVGN